jgi:hypothetical protein
MMKGQAEVAELADAPASGAGSRKESAGSIPVFGTRGLMEKQR